MTAGTPTYTVLGALTPLNVMPIQARVLHRRNPDWDPLENPPSTELGPTQDIMALPTASVLSLLDYIVQTAPNPQRLLPCPYTLHLNDAGSQQAAVPMIPEEECISMLMRYLPIRANEVESNHRRTFHRFMSVLFRLMELQPPLDAACTFHNGHTAIPRHEEPPRDGRRHYTKRRYLGCPDYIAYLATTTWDVPYFLSPLVTGVHARVQRARGRDEFAPVDYLVPGGWLPARQIVTEIYEEESLLAYHVSERLRGYSAGTGITERQVAICLVQGARDLVHRIRHPSWWYGHMTLEDHIGTLCLPLLDNATAMPPLSEVLMFDRARMAYLHNPERYPGILINEEEYPEEQNIVCPYRLRQLRALTGVTPGHRVSIHYHHAAVHPGHTYITLLRMYPGLRMYTDLYTRRQLPHIYHCTWATITEMLERYVERLPYFVNYTELSCDLPPPRGPRPIPCTQQTQGTMLATALQEPQQVVITYAFQQGQLSDLQARHDAISVWAPKAVSPFKLPIAPPVKDILTGPTSIMAHNAYELAFQRVPLDPVFVNADQGPGDLFYAPHPANHTVPQRVFNLGHHTWEHFATHEHSALLQQQLAATTADMAASARLTAAYPNPLIQQRDHISLHEPAWRDNNEMDSEPDERVPFPLATVPRLVNPHPDAKQLRGGVGGHLGGGPPPPPPPPPPPHIPPSPPPPPPPFPDAATAIAITPSSPLSSPSPHGGSPSKKDEVTAEKELTAQRRKSVKRAKRAARAVRKAERAARRALREAKAARDRQFDAYVRTLTLTKRTQSCHSQRQALCEGCTWGYSHSYGGNGSSMGPPSLIGLSTEGDASEDENAHPPVEDEDDPSSDDEDEDDFSSSDEGEDDSPTEDESEQSSDSEDEQPSDDEDEDDKDSPSTGPPSLSWSGDSDSDSGDTPQHKYAGNEHYTSMDGYDEEKFQEAKARWNKHYADLEAVRGGPSTGDHLRPYHVDVYVAAVRVDPGVRPPDPSSPAQSSKVDALKKLGKRVSRMCQPVSWTSLTRIWKKEGCRPTCTTRTRFPPSPCACTCRMAPSSPMTSCGRETRSGRCRSASTP